MEHFTEAVDNALDLLYKLDIKEPGKRNLLEKGRTVYLHVILFKIPYGPPRIRKFLRLRHSLYGNDPEICLFVPNRRTGVNYKKTTDEFIDFCVNFYTEFLEKHKIKGISTVMPVKQLRSEYGTFELKRKLARRFDLFLCKNSLLTNEKFVTALGKTFKVAKKEPVGVTFPRLEDDYNPKFKKNIERAKFSTSFYITRFSDNYTIPFGNLSNTKNELKENLEGVLNQLFSKGLIPGGLKNVQAMHLWPSQSKPIPLYFSEEIPADKKIPSVKCRKRKKLRGVEGELSTQPGKKVFVMPNGEVFVRNINENKTKQEYDSEDEDSFKDESDDDDEDDDGGRVKERKTKKNNAKVKNSKAIKEESESESESESDEEIEKKEAKLLSKFSRN